MKNSLSFLVLLLLTCLRLPAAGAAPDFEAARLNAVSANPSGVSLTLSLSSGRTQFHQGEVISLIATFASSRPKAYKLNTGPGDRDTPWNTDAFSVDNPTGAVDPLAAYYANGFPEAFSGAGPQFQDLTAQPASVSYALNEWLRFNVPGRYRVYLTSGRIIDVGWKWRGRPGLEGRVTTSNAVDLEILPRDPALDAQTLQQALPLFNEDGFDPRTQITRRAAVRAIRFLGTPDAARAMVARYGHLSDIYFFSSPAYSQTRLALFGFRQPAVVTQEMEHRIADADFPVPLLFMQDLAQTQLLATHPQPSPPYNAADPEGNKKRQQLLHERRDALAVLTKQDRDRLAAAITTKQGRARAVSLYTLFQMGVSPPDTAADRALARALVPVFDALTTEEQTGLLYDESWKLVRGPDMLPVLRRLLAKPGRIDGYEAPWSEAVQLDSLALRRLMELSPVEGRALLLTEIQSRHPHVDLSTLCSLPDKTLPGFDAVLANDLEGNLHNSGDWQYAPGLVERYATRAILPRVKAAYSSNGDGWGGDTQSSLLAYFLRMDHDYGLEQMRDALASRKKSGWYKSVLSDVAALLPSPDPDIDRLAIAHLDDPDPEVGVDAIRMLGAYGSPAAEAPLWARMRDWHRQEVGKAERSTPAPEELEYVFTNALATSPGWLADRAKLRALEDLCITPNGRANVAAFFQQWQEPVTVTFMRDQGQWSVVQYGQLPSLAALERKLAQFPRGSRFRLAHWNFPGRAEQAQAFGRLKPFLEARGMRLEEEPFPAH